MARSPSRTDTSSSAGSPAPTSKRTDVTHVRVGADPLRYRRKTYAPGTLLTLLTADAASLLTSGAVTAAQ